MLQFEKQKRMADLVLGRDRHRQMRLVSIMQRRYPSGVRTLYLEFELLRFEIIIIRTVAYL